MSKKESNSKSSGRTFDASPRKAFAVSERAKGVEVQTAPVPCRGETIYLEVPPPEYLLEKARGEVNRKLIQGYGETIRVLRDEKGLSFREIAGWLTQNGVAADYNAVYRVYSKGMPENEVQELDQDIAEEEREG